MQTQIKRYNIEKNEIHDELYLPPVFSRVATDEYYEFRKESLTNINTTLEAFVIKQDGHNQRLGKILEKLVDR